MPSILFWRLFTLDSRFATLLDKAEICFEEASEAGTYPISGEVGNSRESIRAERDSTFEERTSICFFVVSVLYTFRPSTRISAAAIAFTR
jgi:hypothetical protein